MKIIAAIIIVRVDFSFNVAGASKAGKQFTEEEYQALRVVFGQNTDFKSGEGVGLGVVKYNQFSASVIDLSAGKERAKSYNLGNDSSPFFACEFLVDQLDEVLEKGRTLNLTFVNTLVHKEDVITKGFKEAVLAAKIFVGSEKAGTKPSEDRNRILVNKAVVLNEATVIQNKQRYLTALRGCKGHYALGETRTVDNTPAYDRVVRALSEAHAAPRARAVRATQ